LFEVIFGNSAELTMVDFPPVLFVRISNLRLWRWEFDTFTRLLGRMLGLLIDQLTDYDAISMRDAK